MICCSYLIKIVTQFANTPHEQYVTAISQQYQRTNEHFNTPNGYCLLIYHISIIISIIINMLSLC